VLANPPLCARGRLCEEDSVLGSLYTVCFCICTAISQRVNDFCPSQVQAKIQRVEGAYREQHSRTSKLQGDYTTLERAIELKAVEWTKDEEKRKATIFELEAHAQV
jgi:hypothetical protein